MTGNAAEELGNDIYSHFGATTTFAGASIIGGTLTDASASCVSGDILFT